MMNKHLIVIGAGLAGLSAALQAVEEDFHVTLISAMPSERAQSVMAEGGINAALDSQDSVMEHYADTMKAGCDLADPNAVLRMTQAAPELVRSLSRMGAQFNTRGRGEPDLRYFGGQKKKRTAFAKSDTGKQIMTALIDAARRDEARGMIKRFNHHVFETLLLKDGVCHGCVIRDSYSGERLTLFGDGLIVATGGIHGLFGNTTGSLVNTGEVSAALFGLGVPMANLEMIQYHPTTVEIGGKKMLISEAARGEGGRLFTIRDHKRWYFMEEKYPELGNLMPRDITAREIWHISQESPVYLDMTDIPKDVIERKLAGLITDCLTYLRQDIRVEPILVSPGIHYFMGGIDVDARHRTAVKYLYAAGECCAQYHGANRLGGNSLLGAIYGGNVAARTACAEARAADVPFASARESAGFSPDEAGLIETPHEMEEIHAILRGALGVVRDEKRMADGLDQLAPFGGPRALLGRAAIMSAMARQESRGAHYREDYPARDDAFLKKTIAVYDGQTIRIHFESLPERRNPS